MSYNFLLTSWGSFGNLNPLLTAARRLRQRGHRIRVMADPAMRDEVAAAEFDFVTWRRAPTGHDANPAHFTDVMDGLRRALIDPAAAYAADVRDEIGKATTDAVLTIDVLFGAALGAEAAGVPCAMLSPHVSLRPLAGVPPACTGMSAPRTPEERTEVAAASGQFAELFNAFLPDFNEARARLGVPRLPHILDLYDRPARVLLAMSQAFDFRADWLPENVRYVGPLLDQPGWSEPWRAPWSAGSKRPRVLITCSTGTQGQRGLFQRVIHAMRQLDIEAVVTAGPNLDIDTLHAPDNVHLLRSAPHDAVMPEVSLVISQGGHGTVNRALIHGLPLLVLPMRHDRGDNGARVEARGAGLRLSPDASETEIASAAARLLLDPQFGFCARRLGNAIKIDIDNAALVREMEAVAATRPAPASPARATFARRTGRPQPAA